MANIYIIGLDCGATHTKILVWKHEEVVFEADDWPGLNMDLMTGGTEFELFQKRLGSLSQYEGADWLIAMAGLDNAEEIGEALTWWKKDLVSLDLKYQKIEVISDIELVLWAGSPDGVGVGLIAGTGSNCVARNKDGKTVKIGGMSHLMSDEGSGYSLGSRCLHLITKMSDGRLPKTALVKDVLDLYGRKSLVDLKNYLLASSELKYEVARCAQTLLTAAENGDYEAADAADNEVMELVDMVNTANRSFSPAQPLDLFLAGSLFKNEYYLGNFKDKLAQTYPEQKVKIVKPIFGVLNFFRRFGL